MNNSEKSSYILYKLSLGYALTQCLYVIVKLNIADILLEKSLTIEEISYISGADLNNLKRIMKFLVSEGIFDFKDNKYYINDFSKSLTSNYEYSIKDAISEVANPFHWSLWMSLYDSVLLGKSGFEIINGVDFNTYLENNKNALLEIVKNNTKNTALLIPEIIKNYNFSNFKRIMDIGGGQGILLASILKLYPKIKGILLDKKEIINNALYIREKGIAERVLTISTDIFDPIVDKADLYILKSIISNYNDEKASILLNNCSKVMDSNSKLLIIDFFVESEMENSYLNYMDINLMLIDKNSKCRTFYEYDKLLSNSNLKIQNVIKLNESISILEITK